jgi:hypothetical protein
VSYEILWDWPALDAFYRLPPHSAALADRAALRYASSGEGEIDHEPPYYLLRAGKHDLMLTIDFEARTITVLRIYRARP